MKRISLIFAFCISMLVTWAHDFEVGGIYYNITSEEQMTVEVTYQGDSYSSYEYSRIVTIPETVNYNGNTYSVTSIGESAFNGCYDLISITIPASVTSIGYKAFYECVSLTSITLPDDVTEIGAYAFGSCDFRSITLPEGVTSIGNGVFYKCSSLRSITLPEGVTSIGGYAFFYCGNLESITLPESVTLIGNDAFRDCHNLTSINIPASVTNIGSATFADCDRLTSVTIPENSQLTSIKGSAFYDCYRLTSINIPASVTSIGSSAFYGCESLTSITIPEIVTYIGGNAFDGTPWYKNQPNGVVYINDVLYKYKGTMPENTSIEVREGTVSISGSAFRDCSNLTSITIPASVTSIGESAFNSCSSLISITCKAITPPTIDGSSTFNYVNKLIPIYVPAESVEAYKSSEYWSGFTNIRPIRPNITLSHSSVTLLEGASLTLTATVSLDDVTDTSVTWSSSDPNVATVDDTGKVIAITSGTATITATANGGNGVSAQCKVTVLNSLSQTTQQLTTGDTFTYTNTEGIKKAYKIVGENLITNPSFDEGITGWTGGAGGALGYTEVNYIGGVDGGAYIRPISSSGKGSDNSIGTVWDVEVGKTYVFSFFMRNQTNTAAENPAGEGYIKVSTSDTPREETFVLQPLPHVDADLAWTQNTWVVTAEYSSLALCARWLAGEYCFDAFILAEVEEVADTKELEDLLAQCTEWMDYFGDDAKGIETLNGIVGQAQALIDGGEFTAADLNAMVHTLKETLLDFRVANANDENPVDVTARYIKNAKFHHLWTGWTVVNAAVGNGMNIRNFSYFEEVLNPVAEINGAPSTESSISQTVYNLPMGYYRFTVECVMNHSLDVNDPEAKSGAIIFCNGAELDMVTKEITTNGASRENSHPETFSVIGHVTDNKLEVGFKGLSGASFTYVAIDNVKLEYLGGVAEVVNPTSIDITINQYGSTTYCSPYVLDFSNVEGLKAYAAAGYDSETETVTLLRVMTAKAGTGLFIKGAPGDYEVPTLENTSYNSLNMLVGVLKKTSVNSTSADGLYANYKYTIKDGDAEPMFYRYADGSNVSAGKAYLQIPLAWLPKTGQKSIRYRFEEGEGTTDIEDNSEFTIHNSELIYDLYGRRVHNPVKGSIYIVNGKKIVY